MSTGTIYLAHPYGLDSHNYFKAVKLETELLYEDPMLHIFNAVRYFSHYRDMLQENDILERCIDTLLRCDEVWVAKGWEKSTGCKIEIKAAEDCGMVIKYL